MIKTLDRYIVRSFTQSLLLWFVVVLILRVLIDLLGNMDEFTEGDPSVWELLRNVLVFYSSHSLEYIAEMGGIIVVASAAFTIAWMQHTNELTAMLASGVSLYRVVWPIICAAIVVSAIIVIDREFMMPPVRHILVLKPDEIGKEDSTQMSVYFIVDTSGTCWYANEYKPSTRTMKHPLVIMRDANTYRYCAHASGETAYYDPSSRSWAITGGRLLRVGRQGKNIWRRVQTSDSIYTTIGPATFVEIGKKRWYEKHHQPLPPGRFIIRRIEDRDKHYNMTIYAEQFMPGKPVNGEYVSGRLINPKFMFYNPKNELIATITGTQADWVPGRVSDMHWQLKDGKLLINSEMTPQEVALKQSERWKDYLTSSELSQMLELQSGTTDVSSIRMAKFIRVVDPLNNLIMLLLGLPFILSRQRNIKASALYCVLIVATFYVFVYACRYIGLPDALAAFLPLLVFGPLSILMLDSIQT